MIYNNPTITNLVDAAAGSLFDSFIELLDLNSLRDPIRITREYARATGMDGGEFMNVVKLVKAIEPFYDKIISLYLFKGRDLDQKRLNMVNPKPGREHFEMLFTPGILNDDRGIKLPNNDDHYASSFVNPYDLSDMYGQGFFYYTPDNPGGMNWVVGCVPDDGIKPWHNQVSYHPRTAGSSVDYIELLSAGFTYPSRRAAGFTSIRRTGNTVKININGEETTSAINNNFSQNFYATKRWAKIALIGGATSAFTVSAFGVYQSLTDAEHETLRVAVLQFLMSENKL